MILGVRRFYAVFVFDRLGVNRARFHYLQGRVSKEFEKSRIDPWLGWLLKIQSDSEHYEWGMLVMSLLRSARSLTCSWDSGKFLSNFQSVLTHFVLLCQSEHEAGYIKFGAISSLFSFYDPLSILGHWQIPFLFAKEILRTPGFVVAFSASTNIPPNGKVSFSFMCKKNR